MSTETDPSKMDQTKFNDMINRQAQSRRKMEAINAEKDEAKRQDLLRDFFTCTHPDGKILVFTPFACEYGFQTTVGKDVMVNFNCCFNDVGKITIGDRVLIGPQVQIYTSVHPLNPEERNGMDGEESSKPVKIGSDCWIGGSSIILPGVTIGDGVTVGAGSVVTKDVPSRVLVAGNPARVIKQIP